MAGKEIIDSYCTLPGVDVYQDYSVMLNQVDIKKNSNKFYMMQIVTDGTKYYLWTRYGRVGEKGRTGYKLHPSSSYACTDFMKVYFSKTGNHWGKEFNKVKGKYYKMELEKPVIVNQPPSVDNNQSGLVKVSTLDSRIKNVMSLISNKETMTQTIKLLNVDSKRLPLGKISKSQIEEAHAVLKYISDLLQYRNSTNETTLEGMSIDDILLTASSQLWTLIPYASSRGCPPPVINTDDQIKECSDMLDTLSNIQIAAEIMTSSCNDIDSIYSSLQTKLNPVNPDSNEWSLINKYIQNTHAPTHRYRLKIIDILSAQKDSQLLNNTLFTSLNNHKLLFHGSRMANFIGILSEGLRIPLPSQVSNGSVLGRGIYFANSISKSFNYCCAEQTHKTGFILICEVALGNPQIVHSATYDDELPSGCHSRIAEGKSSPNKNQSEFLNGVEIPLGHLVNNPISSSFRYDEFVVYNKSQYIFRYLVQLEMI